MYLLLHDDDDHHLQKRSRSKDVIALFRGAQISFIPYIWTASLDISFFNPPILL